ncbi:MAG: sporulation protein YyaC [Firmicutes bacterium]|nr:sporulation protein YyaC [Bacillota bacterium]
MQKDMTEKLVVDCNDAYVRTKMYHYIQYLIEKQKDINIRPIVILCIGSDRYIGDALGPLVGTYLEENTECIVCGSLDSPVHASNLVEVIDSIYHQYQQPIIVAVDACLGNNNEIGNIEIWEGSLEAGIAVGAQLPCVGHISVIGVVNASGRIGYLDLQSTPLSIVMKLSKCIGGALRDAIDSIHVHNVV